MYCFNPFLSHINGYIGLSNNLKSLFYISMFINLNVQMIYIVRLYTVFEGRTAMAYMDGITCICDKKIKSKQVIGMNMKFLGRNIEDLMCKKHLKEFLNINNEQWDKYIKGFKNSGCDLF